MFGEPVEECIDDFPLLVVVARRYLIGVLEVQAPIPDTEPNRRARRHQRRFRRTVPWLAWESEMVATRRSGSVRPAVERDERRARSCSDALSRCREWGHAPMRRRDHR